MIRISLIYLNLLYLFCGTLIVLGKLLDHAEKQGSWHDFKNILFLFVSVV